MKRVVVLLGLLGLSGTWVCEEHLRPPPTHRHLGQGGAALGSGAGGHLAGSRKEKVEERV